MSREECSPDGTPVRRDSLREELNHVYQTGLLQHLSRSVNPPRKQIKQTSRNGPSDHARAHNLPETSPIPAVRRPNLCERVFNSRPLPQSRVTISPWLTSDLPGHVPPRSPSQVSILRSTAIQTRVARLLLNQKLQQTRNKRHQRHRKFAQALKPTAM